METPELIMKSNIVPIYITSTNMVTPLMTLNTFYTKTSIFLNMVFNILQIGIQTVFFIMKEICVEAFTNMTLVKMVYIIGIYNLFMLVVLDSHQRKITKQKDRIEYLEKQVRHLKKAGKGRDDFEQLWIHDIKSYNQETNKKMISMEKKIEKIEKDFGWR
jgi:hypothetical protein